MIETPLISCDDHLDLNMLPADVWQKRMASNWGDRTPRVEITDSGIIPPCRAGLDHAGAQGIRTAAERIARRPA